MIIVYLVYEILVIFCKILYYLHVVDPSIKKVHMNPWFVAAIATLLVAAGTFYVSSCPPLPAAPRSIQLQAKPLLKPRPLMERTPDEIVNLAWKALAQNDDQLALDVLKYCKECPIAELGEAATNRLGDEMLRKISQLSFGQGSAI